MLNTDDQARGRIGRRRFVGLCVLAGFAFLGTSVRAQTENVLRWGADQEGGGPYIFPKDEDPTQLTGFEVDLAAAIARRLGVKDEFVQSTWDQILPVLSRGNIDIALNGYEYTHERAARYQASIPYYVYELGLCVRRDNREILGWNSLKKTKSDGTRWRIGVLGAAASDKYFTDQFSDTCDPVRYEGSSEAMRLVETGQLDATVQDLPILNFFIQHLRRYPNLRNIDEPVAPGYYVVYARPEDGALIERINQAIRDLHASGELRGIYEKYGIWNETQKTLPTIWSSWKGGLEQPAHSKWFDLERQFPLLLKAATVTIALALLSMPLAVLIGLAVALVRSWNLPSLGGSGTHESWLSWLIRIPCTIYIEIVRGTPLAFQLFVVYYILPEVVGLRIGEFWSGVIALAINYSAYEAEIFRLGLQAIPKGQMEAALSLGMPRALAIRRIILPQSVRLVIPATANDFIALFKDTAVCSVIAVEELSKQYSMGAKNTGLFLEMAALTSVLYLTMSYPLSLLASWLERTLKREAHS
jgi:polar amino acid transport system substrate-binding protein